MNKLKITIATVLLSMIGNLAIAQETPEMNVDNKIEMAKQFKLAKEKLSLTPEQESKFKEIALKYAEKFKAIKNSETEKRAKHKEMKQLKSEKDLEMKAFLSESQFKTYQELQQERKERMKDRKKKD